MTRYLSRDSPHHHPSHGELQELLPEARELPGDTHHLPPPDELHEQLPRDLPGASTTHPVKNPQNSCLWPESCLVMLTDPTTHPLMNSLNSCLCMETAPHQLPSKELPGQLYMADSLNSGRCPETHQMNQLSPPYSLYPRSYLPIRARQWHPDLPITSQEILYLLELAVIPPSHMTRTPDLPIGVCPNQTPRPVAKEPNISLGNKNSWTLGCLKTPHRVLYIMLW